MGFALSYEWKHIFAVLGWPCVGLFRFYHHAKASARQIIQHNAALVSAEPTEICGLILRVHHWVYHGISQRC